MRRKQKSAQHVATPCEACHYLLLNEVHLSLFIVCSQLCGFARSDERHWLFISKHACAYAFSNGLRSDSAFAQSNKRN